MRARIDALLNSWVSKKLMVFIVASFGLFSGTLTSSDWVTVAAIYLGTQGVIDALAKLRQQN